jgi:two-component system LytT family response regulator
MSVARALIVEDERLAANAIHRLLLNDPEIEVIGIAGDGRTAVNEIRNHKPDILFLDIEIPELDGFGVIEEVGVENMPLIIFVTAYDRYTLRAFEVYALDYLLKPFDPPRFFTAVDRAKRELQVRRQAQQNSLPEFLAKSPRLRRMPIKVGGRTIFLPLDEIDYLEAAGNYVCVHAAGQQYLMRDTMNSCENRLLGADFVRIHRSVIVNRHRIKELRPWFTGEYVVLLTTGKELTLSRGYRDRLPKLIAAE